LAAVVFHATPALAQKSDAEGRASSPDDIIVTARRVEERLQDVPISISVFSQEQLANRNIYSGSDLAIYTPSLATNNRFGSERSSFAIRGFTQEIGSAPSVAVYFADVVAPRGASFATSGSGAGVGSFFDLQNVQVLKGPQGTLFGRNTTGGAILLVPKKPTGSLEGYVEASIGNYDMRRLQAVLNVPLTDTLKIRLGVDRNKRDGYMRNRSPIGPRDYSDTDYVALRASVLAELTPSLENYLVATYSDSDTNGPLLRMVTCNRNGPFGAAAAVTAPLACAQLDRQAARGDSVYDVEGSIPDPYQRIEQWQVINTTTLQASDVLTVKNIVSYAEFRDATNSSFLGDNLILPADGKPYSFIVVSPGFGGYLTAQSTFTEELQFQGTAAAGRLEWQAGAYLEISDPLRPASQYQRTFLNCSDHQAFQCTPLFRGPASLGSMALPTQASHFRNVAAYAQGTYAFSDRLRLTAGLRYTSDRVRSVGENLTVRFPAANTPTFSCTKFPAIVMPANAVNRSLCHDEKTQTSSKPTWLINLDFKPVEDVLLYAKYARGYRQGGVNSSATGVESWKPEKVDSYEVGLKSSFGGAVRGSFNLAAFYNDFTDQQLQANLQPVPGNGGNSIALVNAGKSRIWGIEVYASLEPAAGLRFDLGYAYLDTKVISITAPAFDPRFYTALTLTTNPGDPLTLAPKHKVSATASYRLPLGDEIGQVILAATFTHSGRMLATRATPIVANQFLPASNLLNLNLNWNAVAGSPVDLSFFATNVTKEVVRGYVGAGYNSAGFDSVVFGEPRMYGVRLRYRFGN
ncbi:MAG TPA: TonB-dependent receptor, partial [Sphingomicrobium sp.]